MTSPDVLNRALATRYREGTYHYRPSWAPDGRSVLFISDRDGVGKLFSVPTDGSGAATAELALPRAVDEGVWSADGRWLLHRVGSGGGRDIFVRGTGTDTTSRPLVAGDAEEYSPALSPDGRWLAYGSTESGQSEIYVRPFPDVDRRRWQVSRAGGLEPVWSASGRELFYRNGAGQLVAAEIAPGPEFRIASQRMLFDAREYQSDTRNRTYAVSRDGRSFYFIRTPTAPPSEFIVVENFFAELRAKVP